MSLLYVCWDCNIVIDNMSLLYIPCLGWDCNIVIDIVSLLYVPCLGWDCNIAIISCHCYTLFWFGL